MKFLKQISLLIVALVGLSASVMAADKSVANVLRLPTVVGDNMVLQQNSTVNIWGWAKPNSKVTVTPDWEGATTITVKAAKDGKWIAPLSTPSGGYTPVTIKIVAGKESKTLSNILIGEVWLCSGQSNMQFKVKQTVDLKKDLKKEMNTNIRLYNTGRISSETPQSDVENAQWVVCNETDLAEFSAVGYGFGKKLQKKLDTPIGLICASYGGTFIEGWLPKEVIDADAKITADCGKIKHKTWAGRPSELYNANIYPIVNTTIAGVIWYQGCANVASAPRTYAHTLEVLINDWRTEFRNPEMPFYIVQIAPHTYADIKGALLRECQSKVAKKMAHCELVVTNDCQEIPGDIHPRIKAPVAARLANCALGEHYGKKVVFRSPAYKSMTVEGNSIRLTLSNVPEGLKLSNEGRINGFQIGKQDAENPKKIDFVVAEARIEGKDIVVWADGVENPTDVRYCFNEDVGNVVSTAGLPLAPFRTDKSNISVGARPYIEKPSEIAIKVEGEGYTKTVFTQGVHLWPNLKQVLSEVYPTEFEGFEMLVAPSLKKEPTKGGIITALGDGRVYIIARTTKEMCPKYCTKKGGGWRFLIPTLMKAETPEGKKIAAQYIAYKDVKAGDVVEIPKIKDHYSLFVLAKTIEY